MASKASCSREAKFKRGVSDFCKSKKEIISKVKKSRPPTCIGVYEAERLIACRKNGQVKFTLTMYNYCMFYFIAVDFEYTNRQVKIRHRIYIYMIFLLLHDYMLEYLIWYICF